MSLVCFLIHVYSLRFFAFLHERLALPVRAKIRLELAYQIVSDLDNWTTYVPIFLKRIPAATKMSHIHLYGGNLDGRIRIWAGAPFVTDWYGNAEFSFSLHWSKAFSTGQFHSPVFHLASLCVFRLGDRTCPHLRLPRFKLRQHQTDLVLIFRKADRCGRAGVTLEQCGRAVVCVEK